MIFFKAPKHTHTPQTPTRTALAHSTRTKLLYGTYVCYVLCYCEMWVEYIGLTPSTALGRLPPLVLGAAPLAQPRAARGPGACGRGPSHAAFLERGASHAASLRLSAASRRSLCEPRLSCCLVLLEGPRPLSGGRRAQPPAPYGPRPPHAARSVSSASRAAACCSRPSASDRGASRAASCSLRPSEPRAARSVSSASRAAWCCSTALGL